MFGIGLAFVALVVVIVLITLRSLFGPVARTRVERFARRSRLQITVANGNDVIRYLAVTRRWRGAGMLIGITAVGAVGVGEGRFTLNVLAAFAGWFVGAVIAEWRIASAVPAGQTGPPGASLVPRLLRERLRPAARTLPVWEFAAGAALVLVLLAGLAAGQHVDAADLLLATALLAGAIGVPLVTGRHVLARPQPARLEEDRRRADDALRDRALHVLAGSSVALLGFPLTDLVVMTGDAFPAVELVSLLAPFLLVASVVAGWAVAYSRPVPQPVPAPSGTP